LKSLTKRNPAQAVDYIIELS